MKSPILLLLFASSLPLLADTAAVERHVRQGGFAQALGAVDAADVSPEAMFWKGRALVGVRRMMEAAAAFAKVPADHPLYHYAAKGIIYCAWECDYINFVEAVAPLTISSDEEIAALATAAIAEFQLRHTQGGDTASLDELRRLSRKHPEWQPALRLLEVEYRRRTGNYEGAISLCRDIEADPTLDLATRHRARLALAEVYYSQEKAAPPASVDNDSDEGRADGLGEETLLQFIAANPESPLLQEAFRRLALHRAFTTSKYTARRLREWVEDLSKPTRAALALLMQQRAAFAGNDDTAGAALANTATSLLGERAAVTVILEQVRTLLTQGKRRQAELFLNLIPDGGDGAYCNFFRAFLLPPESTEAKEQYLLSAQTAPGELLPAAVSNALFCAYKGGDETVVQELMQAAYPRHVRRALLLTHAALLQKDKPGEALKALRELGEMDPLPTQRAEALLIRSGINLEPDPPGALAELLEVPEGDLSAWSDDQLLRYYRLQLEAVDKLTGDSDAEGIDRARKILAACKRPAVKMEMLFNLAGRLSAYGAFAEALQHLEEVAALADSTETKARALLLAAETAAKLASQESYAKSIDLFEQCARLTTSYADRADIHRARVLVWINRTEEALQLLASMLKREDSLSVNDRALVYTAMADAYAMAGTAEGNRLALEYSAHMLQIPDLPEDWRIRGKMLHATLCARYGFSKEALADYLELLAVNPDTVKDFTKARWFVLAYAGSGAIYRYLQLGRYAEAAALAEQVAGWFSRHPASETAVEQSRLFSNWATNIHRNYY